jgi:hypothetical protein
MLVCLTGWMLLIIRPSCKHLLNRRDSTQNVCDCLVENVWWWFFQTLKSCWFGGEGEDMSFTLKRFGAVRHIRSCIKEEIIWSFLHSSDVSDDIERVIFYCSYFFSIKNWWRSWNVCFLCSCLYLYVIFKVTSVNQRTPTSRCPRLGSALYCLVVVVIIIV